MADDNSTPVNPNSPSGSSLFPNEPRPTGRPVYESNLLPQRRRRRFSPWLIIPALLVILLAVFYFLVFGPKPRRFIPTSGTVVFASDQNSPGVTHLWTMKLGGPDTDTEPSQITTGPATDAAPVFTADGNQLAFLSNRGGGPNQIWVVDGDGKNPVQATRTAGAKADPKFAPGSNSLLGFLSGASLAVMDVGKGDATLLLPPPATSTHSGSTDPTQAQEANAAAVSFAWKPAGGKDSDSVGLAAVLETAGVQTLAVLPTLASAPRLTQNDQPNGPPLAAADRLSLAYAPDGAKMAVGMLHVQGLPAGQNVSGLILFDGDGTVLKPIVPPQKDAALRPQNPVYSPDGTQVVFELWRQTDLASRTILGLFIVDADGTGTPHILAKGDAEAAQFSPDGKQVFFLVRRPDGGHDLYKINADATAPMRLTGGHSDITGFALSPQNPAR